MTPPKKKTAAKGGSKGKTKAAKTALQRGSGKGAKSGAKTVAPAGAKKPPPKKRKSKKKSRHPAEYMALAFFLGLLLASGFFLLMRHDVTEQTVKTPPKTETIAKAESKKPSPLPKIPANNAKLAAKKAEAAKAKAAAKTAETAGKPPANATGQGIGGKNGEAKPVPALSDAEKAAQLEERNKAVASALIDLKSLPYEESLSAGLDEHIRQVDYALIQAAWMKKLPASAMRLLSVEDRLEGTEPYQFQVIEVLPGKSSTAYVKALRECLAAWAEGAGFDKAGPEQWAITVNGIQTHLVRLYPGRNDFPSPSATVKKAEPDAAPQSGIGKARVRKPGEDARLVIVIDDLGASSSALQRLMRLNYPVTYAFWPHGAHTREGARAAHAAGHEILVHQPMEPLGYPKVKPGPNVLLVGMGEKEIRATLAKNLGSVPYAVGVNNHMGSRFTQHTEGVDVVLSVLKERGFFMLDSLTHNRSVFLARAKRFGIEHYRRNVFLDVVAQRESILAQLRQAERIALLTGQAIAIGHPLPETLSALQEWQHLRNKQVRVVRLRDLAQE